MNRVNVKNGILASVLIILIICFIICLILSCPRFLIEQLVGWSIKAKSIRTAFVILQYRQVENPLLKDFQDVLENLIAEQTYIPDDEKRPLVTNYVQCCSYGTERPFRQWFAKFFHEHKFNTLTCNMQVTILIVAFKKQVT